MQGISENSNGYALVQGKQIKNCDDYRFLHK